MSQPESTTSRKKIRAREREQKALELRKSGMTLAQIANNLQMSTPGAKKAIERALEKIIDKNDVEKVRALEFARLDSIIHELWPKMIVVDKVLDNGGNKIGTEKKIDYQILDRLIKVIDLQSKVSGCYVNVFTGDFIGEGGVKNQMNLYLDMVQKLKGKLSDAALEKLAFDEVKDVDES